MPISDWPDSERPRERLLKHGPENLTDAELLAILIGTGTRGVDAVGLARAALAEAKGLRGLLELPLPAFRRLQGLGPARYATIQAALELARRYLYAALERSAPLESPAAAGDFLRARMKALPREEFACLYLDSRHRVVAFRPLFAGSIDSAQVHPREIVRSCLELNAAAVILAHNHPSGVAEPSSADHAITRRIGEALGLIDVRVLDHLVVGECETVSMAARGLL